MISGNLDSYGRPIVTFRIRGPFGSAAFESIIDTAFSSNLTIPGHIVDALALPKVGLVFLEDPQGNLTNSSTHDCQIFWFGRWVDLEAVKSPTALSLTGPRLLHGRKLTVDYGPARSVEIE
jgi:predicted aspartyl protease